MALPLSVNSRVRLSWSDRYGRPSSVTAARGTRTSTRNSVILPRRPKRTRWAGLEPTTCSLPAGPPSALLFIARLRQTRFASLIGSSDLDRRRPVHDGYPALALHPREVHAVEALVALGCRRSRARRCQGRSPRSDSRAWRKAGRSDWPRRARRASTITRGVDVALETDEAVLLRHVAGVAERLRHRWVVLVHEGPVLGHARQAGVVVARHHLGVDEAPACSRGPLARPCFTSRRSMASDPTNETLEIGTVKPASRADRTKAPHP